MLTILENQPVIIAAGLLIGSLLSVYLLFKHKDKKTWRVVDLVWISIGGLGAFVAFVASLYLSRVGETQRSIDLLQSQVAVLHEEANNAKSRFCSDTSNSRIAHFYFSSVRAMCDAFVLVSRTTDRDSDAFVLVGLLQREQERSFDVIKFRGNFEIEMTGKEKRVFEEFQALTEGEIRQMDTVPFWNVDLEDAPYLAAQRQLIDSRIYSDIGLEFGVLKGTLTTLTKEFEELKVVWAGVIQARWLLGIRILSLALLAMCLPLRIAKSIYDLGND